MPEHTHCNLSICKDSILSLLRVADEHMLRESGNLAYLRLKSELDRYRCFSEFAYMLLSPN